MALRQKNNYYFLTLITLAIFLLPVVSKAVESGGIEVNPAYPDPNIPESASQFIYNLDKGESKEDGIKLVNLLEGEKIEAILYSVDAKVTKDSGFTPLQEIDPKKDIGAWIKLSVSEVTLEPKEERIIPFTITIPEDTEAGDHLGAIIVEKKGEPQPTEKPGVFIKTRLAIKVIETVPGEITKSLKISQILWGVRDKKLTSQPTIRERLKTALGLNKEGYVIIALENEGNVRLKPRANIEIIDIFGNRVATLGNASLGTSYGGQTGLPAVEWPNHPLSGRFTADVTVLFGDNQSVTGKMSFWIVPWNVLFIIVLLIVIFIFGKLFWRLYYLKSKLKKGETLFILKKK